MEPIPQDVQKLLGPNEQVQLYIKQKIYHPKINVESVVLTNERIILRHPRDLGLKKDFTDFSYTDVANAILDKGIMRSTVRCVLRFGGDPLMLNDLPNDQAEKAYGIIRENLVRFQTPFSVGYAGVAPVGPAMQPMMQSMGQPMMRAQMASGGVLCRKCGQTSVQGSKFCGSCGSQL